jgi:hypothetical protein
MAGLWFVTLIHMTSVLTATFQDNNDPNLFAAEVQNLAGSTISLGVWTAKA